MSATYTAVFGTLLRQYRHAAGLTQQELAERAGLAGRAISDLERGARTHPYRDTVIRLADALGVPDSARSELFAAARRIVSSPKADEGANASEPIRLVRDLPHSSGPPSRHNLPVPLSSFVGRERELADVRRLLVGPSATARLLTLTGPPGVGKTRLAIEVALTLVEDFADGIVFVPLAAMTDPNLVLPTIARACQFEGFGGAHLVERLSQALHDKRRLLVLDNFEQVASAAPLLARILEHGPRLKALVTSRSCLHVRGERELTLPPLPVPGPPTKTIDRELASIASQCASVQLFVERVRDARSDFVLTDDNAPAVAEICRRLDGLPLAIELAARRGTLLAPEAILDHLRDRFQLLTSGPADLPAHQQTLYQAIAWSYDLLGLDEQRLFRYLAVFVGGFTLQSASLVLTDDSETESLLAESPEGTIPAEDDEAWDETTGAIDSYTLGGNDDGKNWGWGMTEPGPSVEHRITWPAGLNGRAIVTTAAVLGSLEILVDRSLADREEDGARFRMLETIREFGLERLADNGELETLRRRHATCFRALAEDAAAYFRGPYEGDWIDALESEHDNLRAALRYLIDCRRIEPALRLAGLLQWLWMIRGHVDEAWTWLEELLPLTEGPEHAMHRARILRAAARKAFRQSDYQIVRSRIVESIAISRQIGDRDGIAESLAQLGLCAREVGDYRGARLLFEESLEIFRDLGSQAAIGAQLDRIGMIAFYEGEAVEALALLEESLAIRRTLNDRMFLGWALHELGRVRHGLGDHDSARSLFEEALQTWRVQRNRDGIATALASLGDLDLDRGDVAAARSRLTESLGIFRDLSEPREIAQDLELFAGLAATQNHPERAFRLMGAAAAIRKTIGEPIPPDYNARLERRLASVRQALGEVSVAAASAEGQVMTLDQAVDYALQEGAS